MAINIETLVGAIAIILGIVSVSITVYSRRRMSNPRLLRYMNYIIFAMSSLTLFSMSHTIRESFDLKEIYGPVAEMPEYFFVSLTYLLFLLGALAIFNMSREYGFKERGGNIAKEIERYRKAKHK